MTVQLRGPILFAICVVAFSFGTASCIRAFKYRAVGRHGVSFLDDLEHVVTFLIKLAATVDESLRLWFGASAAAPVARFRRDLFARGAVELWIANATRVAAGEQLAANSSVLALEHPNVAERLIDALHVAHEILSKARAGDALSSLIGAQRNVKEWVTDGLRSASATVKAWWSYALHVALRTFRRAHAISHTVTSRALVIVERGISVLRDAHGKLTKCFGDEVNDVLSSERPTPRIDDECDTGAVRTIKVLHAYWRDLRNSMIEAWTYDRFSLRSILARWGVGALRITQTSVQALWAYAAIITHAFGKSWKYILAITEPQRNAIENLKGTIQRTVKAWATTVLQWVFWTDARLSARVFRSIQSVNFVIYLLWQIPSLDGYMRRHFTHNPRSGRSYTMLTSAFSHKSFWHLTLNMNSLSVLAPLLQDLVLVSTEHFLAFYVSAAVLASLGSHLVSATRPNNPAALRNELGASGAVCGVMSW